MQKVNKSVNFSQGKLLFVDITGRASLFIKYDLDENTPDKNFYAKSQKASHFFSREAFRKHYIKAIIIHKIQP